ncbi:MAG: O-methyltransferase family 3 [Verrucomicrobiales bacterium]|nr:O-methyltransferase family 3 [Verrucomicrobiales bacterium]
MPAALRFLPKYLYGICCCIYLFTFGVFSAVNRHLIFTLCFHFGLGRKDVPLLLPTVSIDDFAPDDERLHLLSLEAMPGNVTTTELVVLNRTIRKIGARNIFEIGTFDGRTTLNMAANMISPGRVITLDLPRADLQNTKLKTEIADRAFINKESSGERFQSNSALSKCITQVFGDSASFDFSPYKASMDLVFVDGSHAYEYVLNDAKKAIALIREQGGTIFFHDYASCWPGVNQALNELMLNDINFKNLIHISGTTLAVLKVSPKA